jgi:uncharacterized membrane protein
MKRVSKEDRLDAAISYVLISGVLASVVIEIVGIANYYLATGSLEILFQPNQEMRGANFFTYSTNLLTQLSIGAWAPMQLLILGIVLLMITPYVRALISVVYFGFTKNLKYLFITLFVIIILTASLLIH